MLIRFAVENFRSIRHRQELSLVASSLKDPTDALVTSDALGVSLLRVAAIYGANASGKTNVVRALAFMGNAVLQSQRQWNPSGPVPLDPFLLGSDGVEQRSTFEVDVLLGDTRYNYGFVLSPTRIEAEWVHAYPNGRKQIWLRRLAGDPGEFTFGKNLNGENRAIQSLTRPNSLFLSAAAQNGHQQLLPLFQWFSGQLDVVNPARRQALQISAARLCSPDGNREAILKFVAAADLGIVGVDFQEKELDEKLQTALRTFLKSITDSEPSLESETIPEIRLRHRTAGDSSVPLDFEDESDGTKAYFALAAPVLSALANGSTLCIDELDSSLHPTLALQIVRTFSSPKLNRRNAQLIFNTHDTNLLDGALLRRDQVWFTEKDHSGATHLYPLSDFRPRRNENLARGYLQGRYGAVPVPSSISLGDSLW